MYKKDTGNESARRGTRKRLQVRYWGMRLQPQLRHHVHSATLLHILSLLHESVSQGRGISVRRKYCSFSWVWHLGSLTIHNAFHLHMGRATTLTNVRC
ncbi:hypothetical protein E2C01_039942 [Portunus trituberculatus]|uniref:Uncharacterized protein n=1 Tax=Portunus trituberculatus TaxID=210409 RepID=A0A5B7FLZ6_PORTR|nr:hypothetical protein [Portunus trituberculatus]